MTIQGNRFIIKKMKAITELKNQVADLSIEIAEKNHKRT